jgi:hypothetical protein
MFLFQEFRGLPVPRLNKGKNTPRPDGVTYFDLRQAAKRFKRSQIDLLNFHYEVFAPLLAAAPTPKVKRANPQGSSTRAPGKQSSPRKHHGVAPV